eukprot:6212607-Pleurochrysis_carterae.AAC.2
MSDDEAIPSHFLRSRERGSERKRKMGNERGSKSRQVSEMKEGERESEGKGGRARARGRGGSKSESKSERASHERQGKREGGGRDA